MYCVTDLVKRRLQCRYFRNGAGKRELRLRSFELHRCMLDFRKGFEGLLRAGDTVAARHAGDVVGALGHASMFAYLAFSSMKALRGGTSSPINMENT